MKKITKSKKNLDELLAFEIKSEKRVNYVSMDVEMNDATEDLLLQYAKKNIMQDKDALLNWAVTDLLRKYVKEDHDNKLDD